MGEAQPARPGSASSRRSAWERDGRDWPNREASRFVLAGGIEWHVQQMGQGPVLLLAHGTGAATHSWRALAPILARDFTVVAPDLPGHGFTSAAPGSPSLPAMAAAVSALIRALGCAPAFVVGHSAGAAILIRMCLNGDIEPKGVVSLNGALLPLRGAAGRLFSPLAKLLGGASLIPRLFARSAADRGSVERLIRNTGSTPDPAGVDFYARLMRNPEHVAGALAMMANWDLRPLERDLPKLQPRLLLVAGGADRAIPPDDAFRVRALVPSAAVRTLRRLGHLAHEERPKEVADLIRELARFLNVLPFG